MMNSVPSEIGAAAAFAVLSVILLNLAKRRGYFISLDPQNWKPDIRFWHVLLGFIFYFGISLLLPSLIVKIMQRVLTGPITQIGAFTLVSLFTSLAVLTSFLLLWRAMPYPVRSRIWKDDTAHQTVGTDFKFAAITWCIGFPLVLCVSQVLDLLVYFFSGVKQLPDQLAVYYLKMSFSQPLYFFLSILSVAVLAPLVEEFLFRGFLQSFIRKHLGSKQAILITSTCFSLFHFSPEQGHANISIIGSLFVFSLFLGYIYERQRSLIASTALHAIFNAMSVINLYFIGGAPRGAL